MLTPFVPSLHAQEYAAQVSARPDLHRWLYRLFPFELSSLDQILTDVELRVRCNPSRIPFAIIDKARGGAMGGVIGLINALAENLSPEISWVVVFPAFQRTYVASHAASVCPRAPLTRSRARRTPRSRLSAGAMDGALFEQVIARHGDTHGSEGRRRPALDMGAA